MADCNYCSGGKTSAVVQFTACAQCAAEDERWHLAIMLEVDEREPGARDPWVASLKFDERLHIMIQGTLTDVRRRHIIVPDELPYLIERLMSGRVVADTAFDGFRLRIICEPDTDQGDD